MNKKILTAAALAALLTGCVLTPKMANVIPQSGGIYHVTASGKAQDVAMKSALYSAESTCRARQMRHIVTRQETQYKGMISEDTNKAYKNVTDVIGFLPSISSDDDYQISLSFTCEA